MYPDKKTYQLTVFYVDEKPGAPIDKMASPGTLLGTERYRTYQFKSKKEATASADKLEKAGYEVGEIEKIMNASA